MQEDTRNNDEVRKINIDKVENRSRRRNRMSL